jgi:collagenase-like PrtC family protease
VTREPVVERRAGPALSLGPVLYYWPREQLLDFYRQVATAPVATVYLGETVCSKRRALGFDEWMELAAELQEAGKEVILSTLSLIEAGSELGAVRRICENGRFTVEANDMSAVQMLSAQGLPFCTGPSINIYNPRTLATLARLGLKRWVVPVELSRESLADIQVSRPAGVETEVFAFGRLPLAWSARCYTARALDLPKDACGFRCIDYPDGILLETQENEPLLNFNGVQTQSAQTFSLLGELATLRPLRIERIRISPQPAHTFDVIARFADALAGKAVDPAAVHAWMPVGPCDGYWFGAAGMRAIGSAQP